MTIRSILQQMRAALSENAALAARRNERFLSTIGVPPVREAPKNQSAAAPSTDRIER